MKKLIKVIAYIIGSILTLFAVSIMALWIISPGKPSVALRH